ncbi:hypothetical protein FRC08_002263 [Ceratobasidium sp. 394]|nr:hypothetical protein FRC08_002263 [Ceratobasidium sp. 394]
MIQLLALVSLVLSSLANGALVDGTYRISPNVPSVNPVLLELRSSDGIVVLGAPQRNNGTQSWQVVTTQGGGATIQNVAFGTYAGSSNPSDGQTVQGSVDPFLFSIEPVPGGLFNLRVLEEDLLVGVDNLSAPGSPAVFRSSSNSNTFRFDKLD